MKHPARRPRKNATPAPRRSRYNRLIHEKSPYLLQHAENPVDWYAWGEDAVRAARKEDKPIFLSIGYSTCHWCHVMERESFEDEEVAKHLNRAFICVKVDREERPDLDALYMTACQLMTGSGGWPLNLLLTPDGKPFFAATYIPKNARFGRAGLIELVPALEKAWKEDRARVLESADQIVEAVARHSAPSPGEDVGAKASDLAFERLSEAFDATYGGFGSAPKFPTPHQLLFLLRYGYRTHEATAWTMVERTLRAMRRGGIFDQLAGGFHRYSVDGHWLVPHFEKMLYDQALLAMAYVEAFQSSRRQEFALTAREIFSYVLRDLSDPKGGFYSSEDADSEGEEGRFYMWTAAEVRAAVGKDQASVAFEAFGISPEGNVRDEAAGTMSGKNVLWLARPAKDIALKGGLAEEKLVAQLSEIRTRLGAARAKRVRPHRDDKVLTDWNGLMLGALAKGYRALGDQNLLDAARRTADFLLAVMWDEDDGLLHRWRQGEAAIDGFVDDYAFLTWGLIEFFEASQDPQYLQAALDLTGFAMEHLWDEGAGCFFLAGAERKDLPVRPREAVDGAVPSGNSVFFSNLLRLARLTGRTELEEKAARIPRAFATEIMRIPTAFTQMLCGVEFALGPSHEVVVVAPMASPKRESLLRKLAEEFLPTTVVVERAEGATGAIDRLVPYAAAFRSKDGQPTIYVCSNFACQAPTTSVDEALAALRGGANPAEGA